MYEISKCWEWIAVYNYGKDYSNLYQNSSDFGNNIGRLFFETPGSYWFLKYVELLESQKSIFSIFPVLEELKVH